MGRVNKLLKERLLLLKHQPTVTCVHYQTILTKVHCRHKRSQDFCLGLTIIGIQTMKNEEKNNEFKFKIRNITNIIIYCHLEKDK